ncbi:hypothetical protein FRC07_000486 [Ceratobasidium sp. 392]|nr:hypothetical protein FRC07_000486 [Ceratobasidium sp. 392]
MVSLKLSLASVLVLLASSYAAPTDVSVLDRRATVLADGKKVVVGNLPDWGLIFRASGYVSKGGCPTATAIKTCYVQKLSANPKENLDPDLGESGPVQTSFISTNAVEATGGVTKYTFKLYIEPGLASPSSAGSVPLVQIVSKEPVDGQGSATKVWLDAKNNQAGIYAFNEASPVVSLPLSKFVGKTTVHTWIVKGGPQGYAIIDIKDTAGKSILKYSVNKPNTIDSYRIRVGPIRSAKSNSPYTAYFGDWNSQAI